MGIFSGKAQDSIGALINLNSEPSGDSFINDSGEVLEIECKKRELFIKITTSPNLRSRIEQIQQYIDVEPDLECIAGKS